MVNNQRSVQLKHRGVKDQERIFEVFKLIREIYVIPLPGEGRETTTVSSMAWC